MPCHFLPMMSRLLLLFACFNPSWCLQRSREIQKQPQAHSLSRYRADFLSSVRSARDAKGIVLESGYDANAAQLFSEKFTTVQENAFGGKTWNVSLNSFSWNVVQSSSIHNEFWSQVNSQMWEMSTYRHFLQFVNSKTTLVDFGTWIGPTILFGGQFASRTFGIEGDPVAYAEALVNVQLNKGKLRNVHLQPACVSLSREIQTMHSASAGNSCSTIGEVDSPCGKPAVSWKVQCYGLPYLFKHWKIDVNADTFVKIDVESFECHLLPGLASLLLQSAHKPTLHVAMHSQVKRCTKVQYDAINKVVRAYNFAFCETPVHDKDSFDVSERCHTGELVLSDAMQPV